jgi:environmental stress-induced protein Ves
VSLRSVRASEVEPTPWRNGGGRTRELFTWPAGPDWRLRISVADIAADGPFSAFPGVQRWFAVLSGAGVVLRFAQGERRLDAASAPLAFDGAAAPDCDLVAGPTRDLNLMLRGGARGRLERAARGAAWDAAEPWRACFVGAPAAWCGAGGEPVVLAADSLLIGLPPGPCRLDAPGDAPMFWIAADHLEDLR